MNTIPVKVKYIKSDKLKLKFILMSTRDQNMSKGLEITSAIKSPTNNREGTRDPTKKMK